MSELSDYVQAHRIAGMDWFRVADVRDKDARIAELTALLSEAYPTVNVAAWEAKERGDTTTASERKHLAKKMRAALAAVGEKK